MAQNRDSVTGALREDNTPGRIAQSETCLTADPGVASLIPAQSHTFMENFNEIISTAILFLSADLRIEWWFQLEAKVCARSTG